MKKHINNCTIDELNTLAAKAQGWHQRQFFACDSAVSWASHFDSDGYTLHAYVEDYDPCHNGQQAMDLLKEFEATLGIASDKRLGLWVSGIITKSDENGYPLTVIHAHADTPEIAIVRAVIVSKFGEMVEV